MKKYIIPILASFFVCSFVFAVTQSIQVDNTTDSNMLNIGTKQ